MNDSVIDARQLVVRRGKQAVLSGVSMTVTKGRIVGLIGPSGSGKTTLMRTITGVQQLAGGTVSVLGLPAGHRALRSQIGYVTQAPAIYPDLTVYQNLKYFARLVGATRQDVDIIIDTVELGTQRQQLVGSLSGGQKARVSLAVALLARPELLVLDEPTVGLDPLLRARLWDMFADLAREGKTILVSSHVMDEAERCDDLILLREGAVLWNDTRQALLEHVDALSVGEAFIKMIRQQGVR
jgi:ABC-2 type transport system ATP-binding protein